jgi:hypothetical protein
MQSFEWIDVKSVGQATALLAETSERKPVLAKAGGMDGYVSTATFWCTATADAVGPDDASTHPHVCVAGRVCFAAPPARGHEA